MSKKKPHSYTREELESCRNPVLGFDRTQEILDDLSQRNMSGQKMSEIEKEFFCTMVFASNMSYEMKTNMANCKDFHFTTLLQTYGLDLSGYGKYTKFHLVNPNGPLNENVRVVERDEALKDIQKLKEFGTEWKSVIDKGNHKGNELLNRVVKFYNDEKKHLDNSYDFNYQINPYASKGFYYKGKLERLVLLSKYIYLMSKKVWESVKNDNKITFSGLEIEVTEHSIVHMVFSHYFEGLKPVSNGKSHFYGEFHPENIKERLQAILGQIEATGVHLGSQILTYLGSYQIPIKYKNLYYAIWFRKVKTGIKGQGEVAFYRLESFYPIKIESELLKIRNTYNEVFIDDNLTVLVKNNNE